jgi:general secretion pathway protein D
MNFLSAGTAISLIVIALSAPLPVPAQDTPPKDIFAGLFDFDPVSTATPAPAPLPVNVPVTATSESVESRLPVQEMPMTMPIADMAIPAALPKPPAENINIEDYLSRGKTAYTEADLDGAQKIFEAVLHRDPYNTDAIKWLRRIADKKAGRETKSYETTRTRMLENVQAAWNTPKAEGAVPNLGVEPRELTPAEKQAEGLRSRLDSIRIPAISFQDADIQQVALELSALCRKLDPEHKGANLVVFGTTAGVLPTVTFSGTDLSALEALSIITQIAGMKYDIGPNMVSLTPVSYEPPQQMVSVEFDIVPSVGTKMAARTGGQLGALLDVRDFFSTVPFPAGASAQYNPEFHVLLVRNAPKHIEKVSALLDRYNRKAVEERSRQVEIETKFIEVSQGALEELGFDWTLGTPGENISSSTWTMPGGQKVFTDTLRNGQDAFDPGVNRAGMPTAFNTYAGAVVDPTGTGLIGTSGELLVQKVKGDLKIGLLIRALERTAGSDLLSAPKILTKSGETASIHVGEVHWYPSAFDIAIERYAQPSLIPLDYVEEKTGVMLEVTPELDPETGTINMKLAPEIRELAGFDEQHVGTIWPDFGDESVDLGGSSSTGADVVNFLTLREQNRTISADRLIARRPVFKTRKVNTSVTIEDGSTIAMGGLIKEQLETFKDSVPILGKIPLIGRLFRSEGERNTKRNLLIFVTASQVNASGYKKSIQ